MLYRNIYQIEEQRQVPGRRFWFLTFVHGDDERGTIGREQGEHNVVIGGLPDVDW